MTCTVCNYVYNCIACNSELVEFGKVGIDRNKENKEEENIKNRVYTYYRCTNCSSIQLYIDDVLRKEIKIAYETSYSKSGHHTDTCDIAYPRNKAVFDIITRYFNRKGYGVVIDYGCGKGCLLELLEKDYIDCIGLDLNDKDIDICEKKGLNVIKGDINFFDTITDEDNNYIYGHDGYDRYFIGNSVSVIVLIAVFEHLIDHDEFIEKCKRLLKYDGLLIILSPTAHFAEKIGIDGSGELSQSHNIFCPPWHTILFSIDGMRKIMKRHGMIVKEVLVSPPGNKIDWEDKIIRWIFILINNIGFRFNEKLGTVVSHIFICQKDMELKING